MNVTFFAHKLKMSGFAFVYVRVAGKNIHHKVWKRLKSAIFSGAIQI